VRNDGLAVEQLRVQFGPIIALDSLSLEVERGQLVGFLGPNGSGKTTTMRSILGLLTPQAGTIRWNGAAMTESVRRQIGYMPEERGMYPRMKLHEQVAYFGRLAGMDKAGAASEARRWLERLGLGDRVNDSVQDLSHGNQQRVQLAIALVHEPDLLVLDEPFSGLDPVAVATMVDVIDEQASRGCAVLFSSHQLDLVEDLCRHVVIVDHGHVVVAGDVDALRARAPERTLSVTYADGRNDVTNVGADADIEALLAAARSRGTVIAFSFQPPRLSELFLAAVGR
jgi:ABC-2 type transport system ATP-binding protein